MSLVGLDGVTGTGTIYGIAGGSWGSPATSTSKTMVYDIGYKVCMMWARINYVTDQKGRALTIV